jgi:EmrB/QacA subfamily drug resistance transporter
MTVTAKPPCDEAVVMSAAPAVPCPPQDGPWILAATILASSMVFIDGTVVNIALPALQADFGATVSDAQWVVESFALFLGALLLAGGAAGDRFGRRRVFAIGVVLFTAASLWCGLASSVRELIVARAVQGAGGALLVPGSLAIISASFSGRERGRAIGTWSGWSAMTAALGPVLGGFLIDHFSWRYAFLINVPLGLAVLVLTAWRVPESRDTVRAAGVDWAGGLLATLGLGGTVYALIESSNKGWGNAQILGALALGVAALAAFVPVERRHPAPMLPLELFRSRNFTAANALTLLLYAALGGSLFFFPLDLIQVQGYSAAQAGAALLPFVISMFVLSRWAGGLVDRYGAKRPLVIGPAIAGIGFAMFAVPGIGGSYWTTFFPAVLVLGFGMAVTVAPLTTTVMSSVDTHAAGVASGVNNAVSRVAALLAVAVFGIVMAQVFNRTLDRHLAEASLPAHAVQAVESQRDKLAAIRIPAGVEPRVREVLQRAIAESFVRGFRWVMALGALLAFASAAIAWLMIEPEPARISARS